MDKETSKEIKDTENFIKLQNKRTSLSKDTFIDEIKHELGDEIKKDLAKRHVIPKKDGRLKRLIKKLTKMF